MCARALHRFTLRLSPAIQREPQGDKRRGGGWHTHSEGASERATRRDDGPKRARSGAQWPSSEPNQPTLLLLIALLFPSLYRLAVACFLSWCQQRPPVVALPSLCAPPCAPADSAAGMASSSSHGSDGSNGHMHAGGTFHEPLLSVPEMHALHAGSLPSSPSFGGGFAHSASFTMAGGPRGGFVTIPPSTSFIAADGTLRDVVEEECSEDENGTPYRVYPVRWWVLYLFCLLAFGQSLIWITFSPVTAETMA